MKQRDQIFVVDYNNVFSIFFNVSFQHIQQIFRLLRFHIQARNVQYLMAQKSVYLPWLICNFISHKLGMSFSCFGCFSMAQ
jgi:hypothetical protein